MKIKGLFGAKAPKTTEPSDETGEGLTSSHAATRTEALSSSIRGSDAKLKATLADLDRQRNAAEANHRLEIAEAESTVEATRLERGRALVADFYGKAIPLARKWIAGPTRETGLALRECFLHFEERSAFELGEPNQTARLHMVGHAIADVILDERPEAVNGFVVDTGELFGLHRRDLEDPVAWCSALERMEARLMQRAASQAGPVDEANRRRYEIAKLAPTVRDGARERAAFDADEERRRLEHFRRTYKVPEGTHVI